MPQPHHRGRRNTKVVVAMQQIKQRRAQTELETNLKENEEILYVLVILRTTFLICNLSLKGFNWDQQCCHQFSIST